MPVRALQMHWVCQGSFCSCDWARCWHSSRQKFRQSVQGLYLVTLPHCDPVPLKSLWVQRQQIQQPQVSKHQTTRQKQLPKGFGVCPCWQGIWIAKHCSCAILSCLWPDGLLAPHSATGAAAFWESTQICCYYESKPNYYNLRLCRVHCTENSSRALQETPAWLFQVVARVYSGHQQLKDQGDKGQEGLQIIHNFKCVLEAKM